MQSTFHPWLFRG